MGSDVADAAAIPVTFLLLGILAKNPLLVIQCPCDKQERGFLLVTNLDVVVSVATLYKMQVNIVKLLFGIYTVS